MTLLKVGPIASLPPGSVVEIEGPDARYAVCNLEGKLFCLDGTCPHAGGPLGQGNMDGTLLICPWHGWEFDCRTGANDFDPEVKQQMFPVIIEGTDVFIDVS
jgi:nitrite reductase/ring-hydroxylating ferredoxin subunit